MPFTSWASHAKTLQREALRVSLRHFVVSEPPPRFCQKGGSQDRGRQSQGPVWGDAQRGGLLGEHHAAGTGEPSGLLQRRCSARRRHREAEVSAEAPPLQRPRGNTPRHSWRTSLPTIRAAAPVRRPAASSAVSPGRQARRRRVAPSYTAVQKSPWYGRTSQLWGGKIGPNELPASWWSAPAVLES